MARPDPTPEQIAAIRERLEKRQEPSMGTCRACGHSQALPPSCQTMASSVASAQWLCSQCGGQLVFMFMTGESAPSPDTDLRVLLDALTEAQQTIQALSADVAREQGLRQTSWDYLQECLGQTLAERDEVRRALAGVIQEQDAALKAAEAERDEARQDCERISTELLARCDSETRAKAAAEQRETARRTQTQQIVLRARDYLTQGGLWNPESMNHQQVSDLLVAAVTVLGELAALAAVDPPAPPAQEKL